MVRHSFATERLEPCYDMRALRGSNSERDYRDTPPASWPMGVRARSSVPDPRAGRRSPVTATPASYVGIRRVHACAGVGGCRVTPSGASPYRLYRDMLTGTL